MEKSDHYHRRKLCIQQHLAPTISQVKNELGNDLAEMIFATCPKTMQPVLGIAPPLQGTGNDLWISPSDLLAGQVCLKPPLTGKYMKALTHQGILLIGQDIEKKFKNESRLEKEKELKEHAEILKFMAELQKQKEVEEAQKRYMEELEIEKGVLRDHFAYNLDYELDRLRLTLKAENDHKVQNVKRNLEEEWQDKLDEAVANSVKELSQNFLKELELEGDLLYKKFQLETKKEKLKHQFDLQEVRKECQESFVQLKHQLECKNIANIMYILCTERRKCRTERRTIEDNYKKELKQLQNAFINQKEEFDKLLVDMNNNASRLEERDACLQEILRQFQKFINFALHASPTQAEFLLNVEKLASFELEAFDLHKKLEELEGEEISEYVESGIENEAESETGDAQKKIVTQDQVKKIRTIDLPELHYNKHVYIREGFEEPVSSHDFIYSHEQDTEGLTKDTQVTIEQAAPKTIILFGEHVTHKSEDLICPVYAEEPPELLKETTAQLEQLSKIPIHKQSTMFEDVQRTCCTRCTQTYTDVHIPPRQEKINRSTVDVSKEYVLAPKDSSLKYHMAIKNWPPDMDEEIEMSRLSLACDSFIINRHSIAAKHMSELKLTDDAPDGEKAESGHDDNVKDSAKASKLSFSKDSLLLLRSQSTISKSKDESKESTKETETPVNENEVTTISVPPYELMTLYKPNQKKPTFDEHLTATDSPWITYNYKAKAKPVKKKESAAKIVGDENLVVDTQKEDDFMLDRKKSMLSMFKKHPSLIKLFTACTN